MQKILYYCLVFLPLTALFMTSGCAIKNPVTTNWRYTSTLGLATTRDFFDRSLPILTRHNFIIEKSEEIGSQYYLATHWQTGPPLPDEEILGIYQARSRVILRAKAREIASRSNVGGRLNQVVFLAENEVWFDGANKWTKIPLSDMRKELFKQIADELKVEFNTGLRVR